MLDASTWLARKDATCRWQNQLLKKHRKYKQTCCAGHERSACSASRHAAAGSNQTGPRMQHIDYSSAPWRTRPRVQWKGVYALNKPDSIGLQRYKIWPWCLRPHPPRQSKNSPRILFGTKYCQILLLIIVFEDCSPTIYWFLVVTAFKSFSRFIEFRATKGFPNGLHAAQDQSLTHSRTPFPLLFPRTHQRERFLVVPTSGIYEFPVGFHTALTWRS